MIFTIMIMFMSIIIAGSDKMFIKVIGLIGILCLVLVLETENYNLKKKQ